MKVKEKESPDKDKDKEKGKEESSDDEKEEDKENKEDPLEIKKNPMSLLRGAEYSRLHAENGREALTFYDMNLSAQDHQTFFTCEYDESKPEYEIMQRSWRERNPATRISLAKEALEKNPEYNFDLFSQHL